MDVRCERCSTDYQLEEARISEAGVSVKCTRCGNVFIVRKKAVVVTEPVPARDETKSGLQSPAVRAPVGEERAQEWRVRQPNGNLITFKELTTLQKWIVERKLSRDDEISLTGENWKRLGSIGELSSFFQVVDEAQRAAQLLEQPFRELDRSATLPKVAPAHRRTPPPPQEVPSVVVSLNEPANGPVESKSNAPDSARASAQFENFSFPKPSEASPAAGFEAARLPGMQVGAAEPAFARAQPSVGSRHDSIEEMAAALKRRPNTGLSVVVLLLLLGAVSYLAYRYFVWVPERQQQVQLEAANRRSPGPRERSIREQIESEAPPPKVPGPTAPVEAPPPKTAESGKIPVEASPPKAAEPANVPAEAPPKLAEPPKSAAPTTRAQASLPKAESAKTPVEASPPNAPGGKTEAAAPRLMAKQEPRALTSGDQTSASPANSARAPDLPAGVNATGQAKTDVGGNFDSYMNKADRLREREQPRAALEAYTRANELEPARPEPLAGRGLALLDLGRTTPAIAAFEQALKIDPRYGLALMGLAEAYRAEGNKEQAVRYYEKYLAVLPNGPEAQVAKAAIKALQE